MFVQGKCYKCGGFLAVDDREDASVCPFCGKAFIVEKAINSYNGVSMQDNGENGSSFDIDNDFVADKNVLVRYNGYTKRDITVPDGITVIGENAFQGMNNIESVYISRGVEKIGASAFSGCKNLKAVNIPDSVAAVDRDAFNGCISLRSLKFPDSVVSIEAGALTGCSSLEAVNIPPKAEVLPWRIFEGCTSLKTIVIPRFVKTIEDFAFAECTALETVLFENMRVDGDPSTGLNRIGMNAFRNCSALENIEFPDTLRFIGNQAFRGCSHLKTLTVPPHVKAIYPLAFADCTELEKVTFTGDTKLYKGSNPYKNGKNSATFLNCPKLLSVDYNDLQRHFWAFPAYMRSKESFFMENGKCRYCGGDFKGIFEKVCTVCRTVKDY